jgi:hypothetical protein
LPEFISGGFSEGPRNYDRSRLAKLSPASGEIDGCPLVVTLLLVLNLRQKRKFRQ